MSQIFFFLSYLPMLLVLLFVFYIFYSRTKYKNRAGAGAFFFENNCLVLNTGIPYPVPFDDIDYVELRYNSWEIEHKLSYGLFIKVYKKNGKTKFCLYKGYRTAKLALPSDMIKALEENGIRCVVNNK